MIYKCLLIDDEPLALNVLESYINSIPTLELAGKCSNAFEAMKILQTGSIDILFLDIKMPKLSGTEFLRTLRNPPRVIFTTAFKEFAIEAFDLDAVDYLLKPISLARFIKAITKIEGKTENQLPKDNIQVEQNKPFLYFRVDRKMVKVFLDDMVYVESLKDYVKIVRVNDRPLIVKQSISSLEEMLPRNKFIRIHRSFIISISKVKAFTQQDIEINGEEIPIGRAYQQQLKLLLKVE